MWPVAFVIGFSPCQLLKHLPTCRRRPALVQLVLAPSELNNGGSHGSRQFDSQFGREGGGGGGGDNAPWLPDSARSTPG